jgi:FixJ family two-component response regulator
MMNKKLRHGAGERIDDSVPLVYIVEDDDSMRLAVSSLLRSVGLEVKAFESPEEFVAFNRPDNVSCLVLDIRFEGQRGQNGLHLQAKMNEADDRVPIVFMTGHGDIEMTVKAMKAGAIDFLAKPFRDQDMLDAIAQAIEHDREHRHAKRRINELRVCYGYLTKREREVMSYVASGLPNRQIAHELNLQEITVKIHRKRAMEKMAATSVADLVNKAEILQLPLPVSLVKSTD